MLIPFLGILQVFALANALGINIHQHCMFKGFEGYTRVVPGTSEGDQAIHIA